MKRIGLALINLDRDTERLAHMQAALGAAGLDFERFPAVQGLMVPEWLRGRFFDEDGKPVPSLKPGEIGVYASHLALHKALLERDDLDYLMVMEDDLEISADLPAVLAGIAALSVPFDIVKLSNPPKVPFLDHGELAPGRMLVTYARVPNNLGAYVISRRGAMKTTRDHGLVRYAIDEDMRRPWDWGIETFGIVPAPVRANIFERSSIDAMGERALGRETWLDKLKRRRIGTPADWLAQLRWQGRHLGWMGYIGAISRTLLASAARMIPGAAGQGVSALFRLRGRKLV